MVALFAAKLLSNERKVIKDEQIWDVPALYELHIICGDENRIVVLATKRYPWIVAAVQVRKESIPRQSFLLFVGASGKPPPTLFEG